MKHLTIEELEAGLNEIRRWPKDGGGVQLIVRRPDTEQREVLHEGSLIRRKVSKATVGKPAAVDSLQTDPQFPTCS